MLTRVTRNKVCITLFTSSVALSLTGCSSTTNYNSLLNENKFTYESSEENTLALVDSNICDEDVINFPSDLVSLELYRCNYLTNLNDLAIVCPNIEYICIDRCASLDDLSFVYQLSNLKYLKIEESAFITQELVDYLNQSNIKHTITEKDVQVSKKVDCILNGIINEDMTDEEKVRAISIYLMKEYSYDMNVTEESNLYPLSYFLENNKGVCASYAYLANALIRKANINSYEITSSDHGWNVLELNGKYYYLDSTSLNFIPFFSEIILEKFGIGFYYLSDPDCTIASAMEKYDDIDNVVIPNSLIIDIRNSESEKNIIDKYKNAVPTLVIEAVIMTFSFMNLLFLFYDSLPRKKDEHLLKK